MTYRSLKLFKSSIEKSFLTETELVTNSVSIRKDYFSYPIVNGYTIWSAIDQKKKYMLNTIDLCNKILNGRLSSRNENQQEQSNIQREHLISSSDWIKQLVWDI